MTAWARLGNLALWSFRYMFWAIKRKQVRNDRLRFNFFQLTLVSLLFMSSKLWARLNTLLENPLKWKTTWRQLSELWPIPNLTGSLDTRKNEHPETGLGEDVLCWEMYHWRTIQEDLKCWKTSILASKQEKRSELPAVRELGSHLL